jgi:hypothetical protein
MDPNIPTKGFFTNVRYMFDLRDVVVDVQGENAHSFFWPLIDMLRQKILAASFVICCYPELLLLCAACRFVILLLVFSCWALAVIAASLKGRLQAIFCLSLADTRQVEAGCFNLTVLSRPVQEMACRCPSKTAW